MLRALDTHLAFTEGTDEILSASVFSPASLRLSVLLSFLERSQLLYGNCELLIRKLSGDLG